ncbi:MAG: hypothetical protein RBT71_12455, partial [Flavobacteriales bacterium]|nr:hypothetical protein [Flavobacteriales bacterium]
MRHLLLATVLLAAHGTMAQRNLEVGLATGTVLYYGDLGNHHGAVQWNSARPGISVTVRDFINNPKRYVTRSLTAEARFSWLRAGYDERAPIAGMAPADMRNLGRGLGFRNDLLGLSGHLVLNAYREPYRPLFQQRFFMYFHIGVGVYHGRPKADLFRGDAHPGSRYHFWPDGTTRDAPAGTPGARPIERDGTYETDLYAWHTEGAGDPENGHARRGPSPFHLAIPAGTGVRYMLTRAISLGLEYQYVMFMNDRIDDVSDRYATHAEIEAAFPNDPVRQAMARYISDPTGQGTDGTRGAGTSRRGNPGLLDTLGFLSVEVSYKFKRRPG